MRRDLPKILGILLLAIAAALLLSPFLVIITPMGPGFAPPEYSIQHLFPSEYGHTGFNSADIERDIVISPNKSSDERFTRVDRHLWTNSSVLFFPGISPYRGLSNYTYVRTGDRYIVQAWYFGDQAVFRDREEELVRNLTSRGKVMTVTLDLAREIDQTKDTFYTNTTLRQFNATKFEGDATSGYFLAIEWPSRTGSMYFVAYYGVIGPRDFQESESPLRVLLVNRIRQLEKGSVRELILPNPISS